MEEDLKIIDICHLDFKDTIRVEKLVAQLSLACETSGFFMLKVSDDFGKICQEMLEQAKKVFQLPQDEKEKLLNDESSQNFFKGKPHNITGWPSTFFLDIMMKSRKVGHLGIVLDIPKHSYRVSQCDLPLDDFDTH